MTGQCEACGGVGEVVEEHWTPLGEDGPGGVLCAACGELADRVRQEPGVLADIARADAAAVGCDEA